MSKKQVVETPKEKILDGIITKCEKGTWRDIIEPDKLDKFDNPDAELVILELEVKHNDRIIKVSDKFRYYDPAPDSSKLGRFLLKYETLDVQTKVKVDFNSEGYASIRL